MKTKPKNAKPLAYDPNRADSLRRFAYYMANQGCKLTAAHWANAADKEDAKEPESWRYAGASKLGVEGI